MELAPTLNSKILEVDCCSQQPLVSIVKCHFESRLMFSHPIVGLPWLRVLDLALKEVNGQPGLPTDNQQEETQSHFREAGNVGRRGKFD